MEILIASVIPEVVAASKDYGIRGIATNPTVLAQAGRPWREAVAEAAAIMGGGPFHIQVTEDGREGMVRQAGEFAKILGDRLIVKIPVSREGLAAIPLMHANGWPVDMTAVISLAQAILVAEAGADYLALFVGRAAKAGLDGMGTLKQVADYLRASGSRTKLAAGSIHTAEEVAAAAMVGADLLACDLAVIQAMASHEISEVSIAVFKEDWQKIPAPGTVAPGNGHAPAADLIRSEAE